MQTTIDFSSRGQQLRLRDALRFEHGLACQSVVVKSVFIAIDSFAGGSGWCFAAHESIANTANVGEKTVRRAVAVLLDLYLIRKQKRRGPAGNMQCRYAVNWSNVSAYVEAATTAAETIGGGWANDESQRITETITKTKDGTNGHSDRWATVTQARTNGHPVPRQRSPRPRATVTQAQTNGHCDRVTTKEPAKNPPLPPAEPANDLEEEVVFDLILASPGQGRDRLCVSEARRVAGLVDRQTAETILAEFDHPQNRRLLRSPGAISHRIQFGEWPDPAVKSLEVLRAADERRRRRLAEEANEDQRRAENNARSVVIDLESKFGPTLDRLSEDQRRALAVAVLDPFTLSRLVGNRDAGRFDLLEAVAAGVGELSVTK